VHRHYADDTLTGNLYKKISPAAIFYANSLSSKPRNFRQKKRLLAWS